MNKGYSARIVVGKENLANYYCLNLIDLANYCCLNLIDLAKVA